MRASRRSRMPGAAQLVTGVFLITLPVVGLIIGKQLSGCKRGANAPAESPPPLRGLAFRGQTRRDRAPEWQHHRGTRLPASQAAQRAEVKLVARAGGSWRTLATGRTRRGGRFGIRYRVRGVGATPVRVSFDGGAGHRAPPRLPGKIVGLQPTVASWYDDAGNTACGFHSTYGVANKTFPAAPR